MSDQLILIPRQGEAHARRDDPSTSHAAAKAVEGESATAMESAVLCALQINPQGLTTHEIVDFTAIEYGSVTPRIKPLVRKGWVVDSGERRIPAGRSKAGIVWKATKGQT